MKQDEESLLVWLAAEIERVTGRPSRIGDDTARLTLGGRWCWTVDSQIEGVHFPAGFDVAHVARRLLRVNLSDLAASGAAPKFALLALAAPPGFDHKRFLGALVEESTAFGVELVGGDLARSERLHATLTLLGRATGVATLGRDRARTGHVVWLGGTLGQSALGRAWLQKDNCSGGKARTPISLPRRLVAFASRSVDRHLLPEPQIALGRWLAGQRRCGATIDLSDGFAKDLHRICDASGVGAEVDASRLPAGPGLSRLCPYLGLDPMSLMISGGEDYVLLFTLPLDLVPPRRFSCVPVGRIVRKREVRLRVHGRVRPLPALGWDHLAARG